VTKEQALKSTVIIISKSLLSSRDKAQMRRRFPVWGLYRKLRKTLSSQSQAIASSYEHNETHLTSEKASYKKRSALNDVDVLGIYFRNGSRRTYKVCRISVLI